MAVSPQSPHEMPVDFTGYWKMLANENFEEYLRALGKRCPPPCARGEPLVAGAWGPPKPPDPLSPASARASAAPGPRAAGRAAGAVALRAAGSLRPGYRGC